MFVNRPTSSVFFDDDLNVYEQSFVSGSTWTRNRTPNAYLQNAQNCARNFVFRRRKPNLIQLAFSLLVFWVLAAMLLVVVESQFEQDSDQIHNKKRIQKQFLNAFWKVNQIMDLESQKWNETVETLLEWFENQKVEKKDSVFETFWKSWLAFLYLASTLGNLPGHSAIHFTVFGRIFIISFWLPTVFLYFFGLWRFAKFFNKLNPKIQRNSILGLSILIFLFFLANSQFLSVDFPSAADYLAFVFHFRNLSDSTTAEWILIYHATLWTIFFVFLQKFVCWKSELHLKVVDGLDDEAALLVMLPELKLDRAEHLIHKYSERSFLHRLAAVLFLNENDRAKIAKIVDQFQHGNGSQNDLDSVL